MNSYLTQRVKDSLALPVNSKQHLLTQLLDGFSSGPTGVAERVESAVSLVNVHTLQVEGITNKALDNTLKSFWELESLGIEKVANDPVHV